MTVEAQVTIWICPGWSLEGEFAVANLPRLLNLAQTQLKCVNQIKEKLNKMQLAPSKFKDVYKILHMVFVANRDRRKWARIGVGGTVPSESALISQGTLLSWVRASPPAPWPDGGPESLRSPCCGLAIYENQSSKMCIFNHPMH
ncbi:hypothetical protein PoB_005901000 [Plakobranchus ocellatus]|uniref:Uncharacterized protein n=1 Tax=Plakobranchus ocellatus TaxID=259542 RepID=A0AAV4CLB9_9GAST|nr:hypothetical protein PoB_005901000 [Plakobranchus ocellatus]